VSSEPLSDSLRSFILQRIDSVAQLEVLSLLHSRPDEVWSPTSISSELRVSPAWTEQQLADLVRQGFITRDVGPPAPGAPGGTGFRYRPDPPTRACIAELVTAYATHRIAVVGLIYSKPSRSIASLADAFRLRRGGPQEPPRG
jgi:hypothetical protein